MSQHARTGVAMRVRLAEALPEGSVLSAVRGLPGVLRSEYREGTLWVLRNPSCCSRLAFLGTLNKALGGTQERPMIAKHKGPAWWLAMLDHALEQQDAERAQGGAPYPVGWRQRVRETYLHRYRHRRHGRRDDRPQHWRHYLKDQRQP